MHKWCFYCMINVDLNYYFFNMVNNGHFRAEDPCRLCKMDFNFYLKIYKAYVHINLNLIETWWDQKTPLLNEYLQFWSIKFWDPKFCFDILDDLKAIIWIEAFRLVITTYPMFQMVIGDCQRQCSQNKFERMN